MTDKYKALRELLSKATPGPITLATSNSWRRIVSSYRSVPVCVPCTQADGHPDLQFPNGDVTGPDATLLIEAWNNLPDLLADHDALAAEVARLREALEGMVYCYGGARGGLPDIWSEYPEMSNAEFDSRCEQADSKARAALSQHQGERS